MPPTETGETIQQSRAARSPEELFPLIEFCRAGKLKEVSDWIAAGHPIDPAKSSRKSRRRSPLQIAIEKGFFALAELLLDGGCDPMANGNALADAVAYRDVEISKLLLSRGVPAASVHILDVFRGGPEIIKLFIEHGVDPTSDFAYFHGLCSAVNPLLFLIKEDATRFSGLKQQAEMAMCYYCKEGNLRAVSLLLWAGARPDSEVPDPDHPDDPDYRTTAFIETLYAGRLDILKRLKPQDYPDQAKTLLDHCWLRVSQPIIDYLLGVGAVLNTKSNGGSKLLDHLLWKMDSDARPFIGPPDPAKADETIRLIEHIAAVGAKWIPNDGEDLRHLRDRFRHLDPQRVVRVFRILKDSGAASADLLESLLKSPSFRKRLGDKLKSVEHVLRPPPPPPSLPTPTPQVRSSQQTQSHSENRPLPSKTDLLSRAESFLLDIVRQAPNLHFANRKAGSFIYAQRARRHLGLPKGDNTDLNPIFSQAATSLNKHLVSFAIEANNDEWRRSSKYFGAYLKEGKEWPEATREAWDRVEKPNAHFLTDGALCLIELVQSEQLGTDFLNERSVTARIGLHAREDCLEKYLQEILTKSRIGIRWELKPAKPGEPRLFRIWTDATKEDSLPDGSGLNPKLEIDFEHYTRDDIEAASKLFHRLVVSSNLQGTKPLFLIRVSSFRELREVFPKSQQFSANAFLQFLANVPLNKTLKLSYDFRPEAACWFVGLSPKNDWASTISSVQDELSQPTLEERLGVSPDAAKLIAWIGTLKPKDFLGSYTPVVDDHCERRIGIGASWEEENFAGYLQMLIEEVNEKTDYDLRIQPWRKYSTTNWRIRVARKRTEMEEILKRLSWMAMNNGVTFDVSLAKETLEKMVGRPSKP